MCILHYFRSQNFELLQRFAESVFAFYLESLEVVDKHIWHPKVIDEVQIYGLQHLLLGWPTKTDKKLIFEDLEYLYNMSSATYFFRTTHVFYLFWKKLESIWSLGSFHRTLKYSEKVILKSRSLIFSTSEMWISMPGRERSQSLLMLVIYGRTITL